MVFSSGPYSKRRSNASPERSPIVNVSFRPRIDWAQLSLPVKTFELRPEIRYDRSLNATSAFNAGRSQDAFMFGGDVIFGF